MSIKLFKGRSLNEGQLVMVYRNLHTGNFSIKDLNTRKVLAHGTDFNLIDVVPMVVESGRQRVIREKQKNVHAYLIGSYTADVTKLTNQVTYNPYEVENFIYKESGERFRLSESMYFHDNKCFV